jgi:serine/threonine-protein kinase
MIAPRGAAGRAVVVQEEVVEEERERPMWPWIVAALFVVAAAIAGIIVWHQLSGGATPEPVGLYDNCEPRNQAVSQIRAVHLVPDVRLGATTKCAAGHVYDQDPKNGTVAKGGTVTIWVSTGKPKVAIPKLPGQTWNAASKTLKGLKLKPVRHIVPGGTKNIVTATAPGPGQKATIGSTVTVNVSAGPVIKQVPKVENESEQQAQTDLAAAGFNLVVAGYVNSNEPQNYVVSQDPAPGSNLAQGSSVKVKLSNGPPMRTVPPVVGETAQQAYHDLQAAGFQVVEHTIVVTDPSQDGIVQSQTPNGNSSAPEHSTVTITVGQYSGTTTTGPGPQ